MLRRLQEPVAQQPDQDPPSGFPFGTHSGTQISLFGFGLLGLSLCVPTWGVGLGFLAIDLLGLDVSTFSPGTYVQSFPRFLVLILTGGIVAQGLVVAAFFSTLIDRDRLEIPIPRVWRILALVIPLLGLFYVLGSSLFEPGGSAVPFGLVVPIVGFLTALGGTFWQRRIARKSRKSGDQGGRKPGKHSLLA